VNRILITGKDGQVGRELQRALAPLGEVIACSRAQLDLSQPEHLRGLVREFKPGWIVNAGAYTAVDKAEEEESLAHIVNAEAPRVLAQEAATLGAGFVHFSTDYVFAGDKADPYVESDLPSPLSAYGRSKLAGETNVLANSARSWIFRTSWVYSSSAASFLGKILKRASEQPRLRVVSDQVGATRSARQPGAARSPTPSRA
jgi:dTDP-4-dehydrorhamnose reductase